MPAKLFTCFFTLLVAAIAALPFKAEAAPQILGLVASIKPIPLMCEDGICAADIASICLQEHRTVPDSGTVYYPSKGAQLTLSVTLKDGGIRTLPVADHVSIKSLRGFMSVSISLPEAMVQRLGGGQAALSIGPMASAVPAPVDGDLTPLSADEITQFTGPLRQLAEVSLNQDRINLAATRFFTQMLNRLPDSDAAGPEDAKKVWQKVVGSKTSNASPNAKAITTGALDYCGYMMKYGAVHSFRSCFGNQRDRLSADATRKVWKALIPGG